MRVDSFFLFFIFLGQQQAKHNKLMQRQLIYMYKLKQQVQVPQNCTQAQYLSRYSELHLYVIQSRMDGGFTLTFKTFTFQLYTLD